ncbi:hypothetical protein [Rhizosphaericola mali]|uniref:Uncharacterized protein n=1 Tax=Rhizosphaericola mali TaxID=2545455 RepID=A0A5P2G1Q1_9BACT|nr:hypothetical protein [Rhizosphaericola mali]QES88628.1 hypothetical protein E0W69_008155 [Rhizosphaericola mali]
MDTNKINQPDEETLHTTDPQEHMKGPVSSIVNKVAEIVDPKDPVEENSNTIIVKTFQEVKGTVDETLYKQKLEQLLHDHSEYLLGDLKSKIIENPDEYVEVQDNKGEIHLKFKVKP